MSTARLLRLAGRGLQAAEALPSPVPRTTLSPAHEPFFLENATRGPPALRDADADVVMTRVDRTATPSGERVSADGGLGVWTMKPAGRMSPRAGRRSTIGGCCLGLDAVDRPGQVTDVDHAGVGVERDDWRDEAGEHRGVLPSAAGIDTTSGPFPVPPKSAAYTVFPAVPSPVGDAWAGTSRTALRISSRSRE